MAKISPHPKPERPRHFIREWRKFRNLTQERLAERIDKTHGLISQIENGDTDYTQSTLEALADAMRTASLATCSPATRTWTARSST